jgi:hypothetical protein
MCFELGSQVLPFVQRTTCYHLQYNQTTRRIQL